MPRTTQITRSIILASSAALATLALAQPAATIIAAAGQPAHADRVELSDLTNAPLVYDPLWIRQEFESLTRPCGEQLQEANPLWRPDATLTRLLVDNRDAVEQLLRATRIPHDDFGIEFSQAIEALLLNLGAMRPSARILACDARRLMTEGDLDGACERIAAIDRLADHLGGAPVLISTLVCVAVISLANSQVGNPLTDGCMTVAGRQNPLNAARIMTKPDAFGLRRGVRAERWWCTDSLRKQATGPDAGRKVLDQLIPIMNMTAESLRGRQPPRRSGGSTAPDAVTWSLRADRAFIEPHGPAPRHRESR